MAPIGFSPPRRLVLVASLLAALASFGVAGAGATTPGIIFGTAFKDLNRDGVAQPDEPVLADQQLYLFDVGGNYLATTKSDAAGRYEFAGLADGDYRVEYAAPSWWALRNDWVPTTTGSIFPRRAVSLPASAIADFGWRPITRSRDLGAPISVFTGSSGLRVESFTDAVEAREVYDTVMLGKVGSEAAHVTIRFDYSSTASTAAGWQGSPGSFTGYAAICYDNWVSWLEGGDQGVSHEYGHAWSLYYDTIVQQDGTLSSYLKARGLDGDPRVNSTYAWSAREMIAEDYRQLLGSPNARAAAQMNREIPPAADVTGLKEFLETTFTQAPAPSPVPAPGPTLTVLPPEVAPAPVVKSATVATVISVGATVTMEIRNSRGGLVRTLVHGAQAPAGAVLAGWDRRDGSGRRVRGGTYKAVVTALDAGGQAVTATTSFAVS